MNNKIDGKFFRIIQNMYNDIKSRIVHNNKKSDFFPCEIGVRQGEILSPALFSIYLNDLQDFLERENMSGLETISLDLENELDVYLKIFLFLYADDTVLLSDSSTELQILLNKFANYCHNWKLQINTEKTKILIFSKGRVPQNLKFFIDKDEIEIVKEFKYLGIFFARSGSF